VRAYGFLNPNAHRSLEAVRWLATLHAREAFTLRAEDAKPTQPPPRAPRSPDRGGDLHLVRFLRFAGRAIFDTS
jgi:hypothetical protein